MIGDIVGKKVVGFSYTQDEGYVTLVIIFEDGSELRIEPGYNATRGKYLVMTSG